jgi:putative pyoverdin transport system ATP-binding/permease protein
MLKLIKFFAQFSRSAVTLACFAGLVSGASNILLIALINSALNDRSFISAKTILLYSGICLVVLTANVASQVILVRLGQRTVFELRMLLSKQILKVPLRQLEIVGPHRLLSALTEDVAVLTNFGAQIPVFCMSAAIILGCLIYVLYLSWATLILVVALIAFALITYRIPVNKGNLYIEMARDQHDVIMKHFNAMTKGAKELKLHSGRSKGFLRDLEKIAESLRRNIVIGMSLYTGGSSWGQSVYFLLIGAVVFGMPLLTKADVNTSALIGTALVLLYMRSSLEIIVALLPTIDRARISLVKIDTLGVSLEAQAEEKAPSEFFDSTKSIHSIEMKGVSYTYQSNDDSSDFVLGPIDLTLRSGEIVFLAGGNGSGKTTLAKLITGLYAPDEGEILLDGELVADNREDYRQRFSAVFSDFFLFEKLYSDQSDDMAMRANKYLAELRLEHKVQIKDDTFSTIELSSGQRKRLALLSVFLEDRPICLFDEWAADQDPFFRNIFYKQILPDLQAKGKLVIVISHDERYYNIADRVIHLENGKVALEKERSLFVS